MLIVGAEILVRAAVRLAASLKVRPLIIGLSIVAFGSSAPQMTVSLQATLAGNTDIAVGSVIGSSIFNILVTLGLSALIIPLRVSRQLVRVDIPVMIVAGLLVFILAANEMLTPFDGAVLLVALLAYVGVLHYQTASFPPPAHSGHRGQSAMAEQCAADARRFAGAGAGRAFVARRSGGRGGRPGPVGARHRPHADRRRHLAAVPGHLADRRLAWRTGRSPWAT